MIEMEEIQQETSLEKDILKHHFHLESDNLEIIAYKRSSPKSEDNISFVHSNMGDIFIRIVKEGGKGKKTPTLTLEVEREGYYSGLAREELIKLISLLNQYRVDDIIKKMEG